MVTVCQVIDTHAMMDTMITPVAVVEDHSSVACQCLPIVCAGHQSFPVLMSILKSHFTINPGKSVAESKLPVYANNILKVDVQ